MDLLGIAGWIALMAMIVGIGLYRGASPIEVLRGVALGLLVTAGAVVFASVLGLEASLWAFVGLAIGLVAYLAIAKIRAPRSPAKSSFDFS